MNYGDTTPVQIVALSNMLQLSGGVDTTSGKISFRIATSERMRLTDTGLGIGTSSPNSAYKLHVAGKSYLSGGIQMNSGDEIDFGNSNQYITGVNDTSLTLATGGSATLTATHAGNVGIGTTSPASRLEVVGSYDATPVKFLRHATYGNIIQLGRNSVSETANIGYPADATLNFSTGGSERMRILANGNVGIGNTSPNNKLDVAGDLSATSIRIGSSASGEGIIRHNGSSGYGIGIVTGSISSSSIGLFVDHSANNRNVGIGTTSPSEKLEVDGSVKIQNNDAIKSENVAGSTRSLISLGSDNILRIKGNDSEGSSNVLSMKAGGNVGIGTTSPGQALHVNGNIRVGNSTDAFYGNRFTALSNADVELRSNNGYDLILNANAGDNVGIGTTSPSEKLEVNGNIKVSGNLDIGGSVQKQIQVFPMNFVDDLGTDKHFMPFVTASEQTANYQEEACMVMPADGRVVSVTVHYAQMHGTDGDITIGIETSACGQSYTNAWTVEETETIAASVADDHHVFHFAFDNAKHFESTDKMAISIQQSVDLQNANRFFWVTAVIEYDWSTFLGGTSAEHGTTP